MLVHCLHCDTENDAIKTAGYCDNCGKKLPPASMIRTRGPMTGGAAETAPDMPATRLRTAEALFTAAVVALISGGLFLILGPMLFRRVPDEFLPSVLLWTILPAAALGGLGVLARWSARPALIAALVGYAAWVALGFVLQPAFAQAWLLVHVVLVGVLVWAVWAGLRERR